MAFLTNIPFDSTNDILDRKVVEYRKYAVVVEETIDALGMNSPPLVMVICYNYAGKYIGTLDTLKSLESYDINPQTVGDNKVCSIGFSEKNQAWYGWSHRAIGKFTIGSKVTKNTIGYRPGSLDELYESMFKDLAANEKLTKTQVIKDTKNNAVIVRYPTHSYDMATNTYTDTEDQVYIYTPGKGEWTAKSLEDAKIMAIDYAKDVG